MVVGRWEDGLIGCRDREWDGEEERDRGSIMMREKLIKYLHNNRQADAV